MEGENLVLDLRVQELEAVPKASPKELEESRLKEILVEGFYQVLNLLVDA